MSISSSIGGNPLPSLAGEALGPQFRNIALALDDATKGLRGFTPAITNVTAALKGFAAAGSPNGMKPLTQAFDLMASTVGVVVTPAFVLLGAGVAAAAATIMGDLEPALDSIAQWYADNIDVFERFGKAVVDVTEWIARKGKEAAEFTPRRQAEKMNEAEGSPFKAFTGAMIRHWGNPIAGFATGFWDAGMAALTGGPAREQAERQKRFDRQLKAAGDERPDFVGPRRPPGLLTEKQLDQLWARADEPDPKFQEGQRRGAFRGKMADMLHGMVAGMQMDMGAAPGFRRIEDAWRQAQLSAFESPMQAMIRQNWQKTIDLLLGIERRIRDGNRPPNAVVGGNAAAGR